MTWGWWQRIWNARIEEPYWRYRRKQNEKFYEKNELWFALILIIVYSVGQSLAASCNTMIAAYACILLKTLPKKQEQGLDSKEVCA